MTETPKSIELTADIVASHVSNNLVSLDDLPRLIEETHAAVASLGRPKVPPKQEKTPAVSARASVRPDYIVCMECGRRHKALKRHLQSAHGLTPDQYRTDYGLSRDYPMVAPLHSRRRAEVAHSMGLGKKRTAKTRTAKAAQPQRSKAKTGK